MFLEFKNIIKKNNYRGWSLQKDSDDNFYLSKFDNGINDDEYRIFFGKNENDTNLIIKKCNKVRINNRTGSIKIVPVSEDHKIVVKAIEIINMHSFNKNNKIHI